MYFIQNDKNKLRLFSIIDKVFNTKNSSLLKNIIIKVNKFSRIRLFYLLIFNFIFIIFLVLFNIYILIELSNNIDSYISVYIDLHNNTDKSLFILGSFTYKNCCLITKNLTIKHNSSLSVNDDIETLIRINKLNLSNVETFINYDINTKIKLFGSYENFEMAVNKLYDVNEEFLYNFYPDKINDFSPNFFK